MLVAGSLLALAAAVADAFAIVLQAVEARDSPTRQSARFSALGWLVRRPRWLLGTGLLIVAWPLQVLALAFAPITVVQPILACFQLVLLVLARFTLHERIGRPEVFAALAIVLGIAIIVGAAPRHTFHEPRGLQLVVPLVIVGGAALLAYGTFRVRQGSGLLLVVGAGLGYAWADYVNKLLSNEISSRHWGFAALWLLGILGIGALAFGQENLALQRRPAVQVGPVIGAIQDPLPVLMALAAGAETWSSSPAKVAALVGGLALVAVGAAVLARSPAVVTVSAEAREEAD